MALGKVIPGDLEQRVIELTKTVHSLLHMIETAKASVTATATAEQILSAWSDAVNTGADTNPSNTANISSSGRPILGVISKSPMPRESVVTTKTSLDKLSKDY
jgi:hypothetical protein